MHKFTVVAVVGVAVAVSSLMIPSRAGGQLTTSTTKTLFISNGTNQAQGTINRVELNAATPVYTVKILARTGTVPNLPVECTVKVDSLAIAIELREQITGNWTTSVTCNGPAAGNWTAAQTITASPLTGNNQLIIR